MTQDASGWVDEMLQGIRKTPDIEASSAVGLAFSETLGRRTRSGDWEEQAFSTYQNIRDAVGDGRFSEAAILIDFFRDEAEVIYGIFRSLIPDGNQFLMDRGVLREELESINARILDLLSLPDGRPFHARRLWEEFRSIGVDLIRKCGEGDRIGLLTLLEQYKETWRLIQDRDVDHFYGLLNEAVNRFGEPVLSDIWDFVIGPLFKMRYAKFDIADFAWSESLPVNLYLAFESMRGHLVGPDRLGNIEFEEDEERFTFRFDPCGSGGRILRGDSIEGSPSRMEGPYNWGVTKERHDFAWNKQGVCYYCTHCCVVMQLKPIEAFGYPVRVVEPPTYPDNTDSKCTWHVYKDPLKVPERYYQDVGRDKERALLEHGLREDPDT